MGATEIRDLVGLGLGSPRSPEGHTTGLIYHLIITLNYNDLFNNIYNIHLYTCFLLFFPLSVSAETLCRIALRAAALTCLTFGLGCRHGFSLKLAYSLPGRSYVTCVSDLVTDSLNSCGQSLLT